jgi:hypothetical protein
MSNRVGFGRRPWAQKYIQTLFIRVGYPWISMSMGKIAILTRYAVLDPLGVDVVLCGLIRL